MDISKVSGYSAVNQQTTTTLKAKPASGSAQEAIENDPNKSAIMTYLRGQQPVTALDPLDQSLNDFDLVKTSAIAEARKELSERQSLEEKKQREEAALERAKKALNDIKSHPLALRFDTAEDYNDAHVMRVVDATSEELIRQIPTEELLRVSLLISTYKERLAHEEMTTDPQLKAHGVTTNAQESENLRGVVLDDLV